MVDQDVLKVYPVMENPLQKYNGIEENMDVEVLLY
jgi:hypothetical protein